MKIEFIAIGKIKEKYLQEGITDYESRLCRFFDFKITELTETRVPDKHSSADVINVLEEEANNVRKYLRPKSFKIVMAIEGKQLSSLAYAELITRQATSGVSDIQILIGSTFGVSELLKREADFLFSLGSPTYPHQLMRLILAEQTYRAAKIIRNEKYHN